MGEMLCYEGCDKGSYSWMVVFIMVCRVGSKIVINKMIGFCVL